MANAPILVTGASGFVGRFLVRSLLARGDAVAGAGYNDKPADWPAGCPWHDLNLLDLESVARLPRETGGVIHLAGDTVPSLMREPATATRNAAMLLNLLGHLAPCRFLFVSSAHVYTPSADPQREDQPVRPQGLYGLSKHLAEQAAQSASGRLDIRIARPFNHIGPGMRPELMIPSLIRRIREEAGSTEPLRMAGQDSVRDYLDVRDIVAAYLAILDADPAADAVYNVCSGQGRLVSEVAAAALKAAGQTRAVAFAETPLSSDDTSVLTGDPAKLMNRTGWRPVHSLDETMAWLMVGSA